MFYLTLSLVHVKLPRHFKMTKQNTHKNKHRKKNKNNKKHVIENVQGCVYLPSSQEEGVERESIKSTYIIWWIWENI